jgi:hypothetical protein
MVLDDLELIALAKDLVTSGESGGGGGVGGEVHGGGPFEGEFLSTEPTRNRLTVTKKLRKLYFK